MKDAHRDNVQEHFYYGKVYLDQGEYDNAIGEFQRALELAPRDANVIINLGKSYLFKGAHDEALKCLEEAVRLAPQYADGHFFLGKVYLETGVQEKAINEFKESLNINPRYIAAKRLMNQSMKYLEAAQDEKNGGDDATHREDRISRQANIHFHLGNALLQKGLYQEALLELKEAVRLRPNFPDIRCKLGELYMKQSVFQLAEEEFLMALKINPRFLGALVNLAESYRLHSDELLAKAESSFRKALEVSPENQTAMAGLEKVKAAKSLDFV